MQVAVRRTTGSAFWQRLISQHIELNGGHSVHRQHGSECGRVALRRLTMRKKRTVRLGLERHTVGRLNLRSVQDHPPALAKPQLLFAMG